jgi:DNA-binding IclR family transcriptional regulator
MASTPRSKSIRRPTVKAVPEVRPPGRAMRGLVKVARPKASPIRAAKPKIARPPAAKAKRGAAKPAATRSMRNAATRETSARAPHGNGAAAARKIAAGKAASKRAASSAVPARKSAARKPAAKTAAAPKPVTKNPASRKVASTTQAGSKTAPRARSRIAETPRKSKSARATHAPAIPAVDLVAREKELAREHGTTAVNRALSLLETLARTGPVPLAVLADAAGCGKTTAFGLLTTMQGRNFVIQDDGHGLWRLGARWAVLGSAASEQGALAATAMPYLAALGNATGENVYLRVREGMESETVAIYQTDPGLRVYTEVGKKMPLHAGSGRVLLAHAPEAVQTQVLAQRLQRYTPSTRIDPSWIAADLHRIRTRGFLITDSEVVAGTVSICAPVRDASGQVVAAVLIGAPSLRMRPPRPRALMPAVVETARKLSHALGSISEQPAAASNGAAETRPTGAFSAPAWPTAALGATIARPHSIFR